MCCVLQCAEANSSFFCCSVWDQTVFFERSLFSLVASVSRLLWHFPRFTISELFVSACMNDCLWLLSLALIRAFGSAVELMGCGAQAVFVHCASLRMQHTWRRYLAVCALPASTGGSSWAQQGKGYQGCVLMGIPCLALGITDVPAACPTVSTAKSTFKGGLSLGVHLSEEQFIH